MVIANYGPATRFRGKIGTVADIRLKEQVCVVEGMMIVSWDPCFTLVFGLRALRRHSVLEKRLCATTWYRFRGGRIQMLMGDRNNRKPAGQLRTTLFSQNQAPIPT